ncbi:C2H2-type domain-containing protein [Trichostrongylus colubriformis]|uniref:C2H2-type domain-containing protein n=1 Tax=Trichostrongylus colubriformis TaxID=6319 RepID=A0AAN8IZS1_TRICO
MVYLLVDLENQAQLSDVVTFLLSRSYNVFHVNNDNPCPKCSMLENRNGSRSNAMVRSTIFDNVKPPKLFASEPQTPGELLEQSQTSSPQPPVPTISMKATTSDERRTSFATSDDSLPLFSNEHDELKPDMGMLQRNLKHSIEHCESRPDTDCELWYPKDSWFSSTCEKEREHRESEDLSSAMDDTAKLHFSSQNLDGSEASSEDKLWAPTYKLVKKQKLGNTVHCNSCKWSVQANFFRMRMHVNNVHKRFNRFRCNYCNEKFVHLSKAERHQRSHNLAAMPVIRLKWTPQEVLEIKKTMIECFGFNV